MKKRSILTENDLRVARARHAVTTEIRVASGTFVTPLAKEYMRDHGIRLIEETYQPMPCGQKADRSFTDWVTGAPMEQKGEYMTHLHGSALVLKNHPRIMFRGAIDHLQAEILLLQTDMRPERLRAELDGILETLRHILSAEVRDAPLEETQILGMDEHTLHEMSHHVREHFGFDHPTPSADMDRLALRLNLLRTQVREAERLAVDAFPPDNGQARVDIVRTLNRLSSAVYVLFCRVLAGYYKENRHGS